MTEWKRVEAGRYESNDGEIICTGKEWEFRLWTSLKLQGPWRTLSEAKQGVADLMRKKKA
jgi:hypothetical protein